MKNLCQKQNKKRCFTKTVQYCTRINFTIWKQIFCYERKW